MYSITPREVVEELGKHIVGQQEAKKAVCHRFKKPLPPQTVK